MRLIPPSCITPEAAYDALHAHCAGAVARQVELLTGNPALARRAVRYAFDLAWQQWPAVAVDPDPVGWVRAAAHEHALAPWQRWIPGRRPRRRAHPGGCGIGSESHTALLRLPPASRRAVLLYDGLGLDLSDIAAETAASTAATAARVLRARAALGEGTTERLAALLGEAGPDGTDSPVGPHSPAGPDAEAPAAAAARAATVAAASRRRSERRTRRQTYGVVALTAGIALSAGLMDLTRPARPPAPSPAAVSVQDPSETDPEPRLRRDLPSCAPYDQRCDETEIEPREGFH